MCVGPLFFTRGGGGVCACVCDVHHICSSDCASGNVQGRENPNPLLASVPAAFFSLTGPLGSTTRRASWFRCGYSPDIKRYLRSVDSATGCTLFAQPPQSGLSRRSRTSLQRLQKIYSLHSRRGRVGHSRRATTYERMSCLTAKPSPASTGSDLLLKRTLYLEALAKKICSRSRKGCGAKCKVQNGMRR